MARVDWKLAWHLLTVIVAIVLATSYLMRHKDSKKQKKHIPAPVHKLWPPNPEVPLPPSVSHLKAFERAAVCSDSLQCSSVGSEILKQNGSAVDGALATLICNGLVAMQSMGLGGGFVMTIYSAQEKKAYSLLSRERAPNNVNIEDINDLAKNDEEFFLSSLAIGVPGELMGYAVAHEHFGKLPWSALVKPSIEICKKGFSLTKHQLDSLNSNKRAVLKDKHLMKMFMKPNTKIFHPVGHIVKPPKELCRTLTILSEEGPRSFYNGSLSVKVINDLQNLNSPITMTDLQSFQVNMTKAVALKINNYKLFLSPPPGSGYILYFIMNILKNFQEDFEQADDFGKLEIHRIAEALKFAFVKRWDLDTTIDRELLRNLTSRAYAANVAKRISVFRTFRDPVYYGFRNFTIPRNEKGTAQISVLAPNGDAVSVTSSINYYFGVGRTGARTGILFNNALTDFSFDGYENYFKLVNMPNRNRIKPGDSPMSSMSPIILTDENDHVRLVTGAAGGSKILSVLTQVLVRILWLKQNIKQAIDAPRFHHQLVPDILEYEFGILQEYIEELELMGHKTERYRVRRSAVCGVELKDRAIYANADYRKDGDVAGF